MKRLFYDSENVEAKNGWKAEIKKYDLNKLNIPSSDENLKKELLSSIKTLFSKSKLLYKETKLKISYSK